MDSWLDATEANRGKTAGKEEKRLLIPNDLIGAKENAGITEKVRKEPLFCIRIIPVATPQVGSTPSPPQQSVILLLYESVFFHLGGENPQNKRAPSLSLSPSPLHLAPFPCTEKKDCCHNLPLPISLALFQGGRDCLRLFSIINTVLLPFLLQFRR